MSYRKDHFNYDFEKSTWSHKCKCVDKPTICKKIQEIPHCITSHNLNHTCGNNNNSNIRFLISVKNPQSILEIPVIEPQLVPGPPLATVDLIQWTNLVADENGLFNNLTGTYVVPETGNYQIELTLSYETSVTLTPNFDLTNIPYIEVYDANTDERILVSQLSATQIVVPIPPVSSGDPVVEVSVSSIVSRAQVIINAVVNLEQGQRVRIRASNNGLSYTPPELVPELPTPPFIKFFGANADTTLAIYEITQSNLF